MCREPKKKRAGGAYEGQKRGWEPETKFENIHNSTLLKKIASLKEWVNHKSGSWAEGACDCMMSQWKKNLAIYGDLSCLQVCKRVTCLRSTKGFKSN